MKLKLYLMALLVGIFTLQSCDDDDPRVIPTSVKNAFAQKYPSSVAYDWEKDRGYYVAEFRNDGREAEAWFNPDGTWVKTETDFVDVLPEAVQDYIDVNYPGYRIDDVDWVETPSDEYFDIELERNGKKDVYLHIRANGERIP